MRLDIDESQQHHIYMCLKEGEKALAKAKKSSEPWVSTNSIDAELEINKELRRMLNPRAEDEAREEARKKSDPTQMSIEDQPASSGETGGRVAGAIKPTDGDAVQEIPPTDTVIRDNLSGCGIMVPMAEIKRWTSSERESVVSFAREFDRFEPNLTIPSCLELVSLTESRMRELVAIGPYKIKGFPVGAAEPTSTLVYLPGSPGEAELIANDLADPLEAEIQCALMNRRVIRDAEIDPAVISAWFGAGPWSAVGDDVKVPEIDIGRETRWYVIGPESIQERVEDDKTATRIAAIYNRNAAGREASGEWKPAPSIIELMETRPETSRAAPDGGGGVGG